MRLCCVRINHFAPAPPNDVDEDTSCRRWTSATRCLTRIVPYTEVDAQRDKPAKVVDRTSTVASNVNLVRSTTVQLIKTSEHICGAKLQRTALLRLPYLYLDCNDQRAVAKFSNSRVWDKVLDGNTPILEIPEFPYNTVWYRRKRPCQ